MIFFACQESRKPEKIIEVQPEKNKTNVIRTDTLFLNLSPNMTEIEFDEAIMTENEKRLINGKFHLSLNYEILDFSVSQNNKSIELYYSKFFSRNELKNNSHQKLFNELISIFNKKYDYHNYADFPNHLNYDNFTKTYLYYNPEKSEDNSNLKRLTEYGFDKTNYAVFNDSLKTIVIGFSTKKNNMMELLNTSRVPIRNGFKNDNESQSIESKKTEYDDIKMFEYNITIDYFLTKDFDSIKNIIEIDYEKFMSSFKTEMEKNEKNMNKIEKNKSEL